MGKKIIFWNSSIYIIKSTDLQQNLLHCNSKGSYIFVPLWQKIAFSVLPCKITIFLAQNSICSCSGEGFPSYSQIVPCSTTELCSASSLEGGKMAGNTSCYINYYIKSKCSVKTPWPIMNEPHQKDSQLICGFMRSRESRWANPFGPKGKQWFLPAQNTVISLGS